MQFQFTQYAYQTDAADAVCDVFDGQPNVSSLDMSYIPSWGSARAQHALPSMPKQHHFDLEGMEDVPGQPDFDETEAGMPDDQGYGNAGLVLESQQLLANVNQVQQRNQIPLSNALSKGPGAVQLDVEMETGTGKTFVYTKTMFELNLRYGWTKFIVVVPSIAIREGVAQSLRQTADYFFTAGKDGKEGYGKRLHSFIYSSDNIEELRTFATSPDMQVMIINMQAFNTSFKDGARNKAARRIFSEMESFDSQRPIDVIKAVHPIMILDEPQKMGGKATQEGIGEFEPLFVLNYSATHKEHHDLVYALDSLDAYNQRLVKRIEVKGFEIDNINGTDGYVYLQGIDVKHNAAPTARIEYRYLNAYGKVRSRIGSFHVQDSLYAASGEMEAYEDDMGGWRISEIVPDQNGQLGGVRFLNGTVLHRGEIINDGTEADLRRVQIRETILSHLNKEEMLYERGIKCLSLFFIDEVAKYRQYDEHGEQCNGEYATMFEEEYEYCVRQYLQGREKISDGYVRYLRATTGFVQDVHAGYFSIDRKTGHSIDSKAKGKEQESDDRDAYELILKDKERLLSFNERTRFIFSHSALREGWDNPNVFQICTLKHSANEIGKRQEVGRGLRLCVNQDGVRQDVHVLGEDVQRINLLTVIASESYEQFAKGLQNDMASNLRHRPQKVTAELLSRIAVPADKMGDAYTGTDPVRFTEREADEIYSVLKAARLIKDGQPTSKLCEEGLMDSTVFQAANAEWEPELRAKIPAIAFILESVVEGTLLNVIGNAMREPLRANPLNSRFRSAEFQNLWKRINHRYTYTVDIKDATLEERSIAQINEHLKISPSSYTVTQGEQRQQSVEDEVRAGRHFAVSKTRVVSMNAPVSLSVRYDLVGEVAQAAYVTRANAARILTHIAPDKFRMFKINPERFIAETGRIIRDVKNKLSVEQVVYRTLEGTHAGYDAKRIFEQSAAGRYLDNAYPADKCVQDYVVSDSTVEQQFAKAMDISEEVAVYAKLPRGFVIPTPAGDYAPDWAVVFRDGLNLHHLLFVTETKGTMRVDELRGVEQTKIACVTKLFNECDLIDGVRYELADDFKVLLDRARQR